MKSLILASLVSLSTGCIVTDDGYVEEVGFISSAWQIKSADGTRLDCPAGFDTAEVTAVSRTFGDAFIDLYDCDAFSGVAPYPLDEYDVTIAITNRSGSQVYAQSLTHTVDIFFTDVAVGEDFIDDGGRILFDWALVDAETNRPLDCVTAGSQTGIKVDAVAADTVISTTLACGAGFGVSKPLPAGTYTATITAVDANDRPLGASVVEQVTVRDRNDYDDLGTITLPIGAVAAPPTP